MKHSSSSIRSLQSGSRPVFRWDLGSFLTTETPCPFLLHFWEDKIISNADFDLKKKKKVLFFSLLTSHHNTNPGNWFTASCWREISSNTFLSLIWRTTCPPLQEVPKAQRSHQVTLLAGRHGVPTLAALLGSHEGPVAGKGRQVSTVFPLKTSRIRERVRLCRHLV